MRFAYADPPYFGCGKRHYTQHHDDAAKWDTRDAHLELVATLRGYDGAALSCLARDLAWLLPACPGNALVAAWVKPFGSGFKPNQRIIRAWEPVVYWTPRTLGAETVRDVLTANAALGTGLVGAKPPAFNRWVIDLLGVKSGDTLDDLFPGTGSMQVERCQGVLL